jgi:heme-degrading monooxygenase HmoA
MILEHAVLDVIPGREAEFESAFAQARPIIASSPGCKYVSLSRCLERANCYLLIVDWERLEDHTEGFRGSPAYQEWRQLLHHFYDPFPTVEHFQPIGQRRHVSAEADPVFADLPADFDPGVVTDPTASS